MQFLGLFHNSRDSLRLILLAIGVFSTTPAVGQKLAQPKSEVLRIDGQESVNLKIWPFAESISKSYLLNKSDQNVDPKTLKKKLGDPEIHQRPMRPILLADGPSGSGGGNPTLIHLAEVERILKKIFGSLETKSDLDKFMALADWNYSRQMTCDLQRLSLSLDWKVFSNHARMHQVSKSILEVFDVVAYCMSKNTGEAFDHVRRELQNKFDSLVRLHEFYDLSGSMFVASENIELVRSGCRDRVRLQGDPHSGRLVLFADSSKSTCLDYSPVSGQNDKSKNVLFQWYHKPQITFDCQRVKAAEIICESIDTVENLDQVACPLESLKSSFGARSRLSIYESEIRVAYQWCAAADQTGHDDEVKKYQHEVTYPIANSLHSLDLVGGPQNGVSSERLRRNLSTALDVVVDSAEFIKNMNQSLFEEAYNMSFSGGRPPVNLRAMILNEIGKLSVVIEETALEPFWHLGSETWIETDNRTSGVIRLRPRHLPKGSEMSPSKLIFWIAHEVAHHLASTLEPATNKLVFESSVMKYTDLISGLVFKSQTVPSILRIEVGTYGASLGGCRDRIEVDGVDSRLGTVAIRVSTSQSHCRSYGEFLKRMKIDEEFPFDTAKMVLVCKEMEGQVVCRDRDVREQARFCLGDEEVFSGLNENEVQSSLTVYPKGGLVGHFFWCLNRDARKISFAETAQAYQPLVESTNTTLFNQSGEVLKPPSLPTGGGLIHFFAK